jgi:hypothetical protein
VEGKTIVIDCGDQQPLATEKQAAVGGAGLATGTSPRSEGEDSESHGSGIKLGLFGSGRDDEESEGF